MIADSTFANSRLIIDTVSSNNIIVNNFTSIEYIKAGIIVVILILFTLYNSKIIWGTKSLITSLAKSLFSNNKLLELALQPSGRVEQIFLLIILSAVNSIILLELFGTEITITITIAVISLYFIRKIFFSTLNWCNNTSVFKLINRITLPFFNFVSLVFFTIGLTLIALRNTIDFKIDTLYFLPLAIIFLLYIKECCQLIFSKGFSHFFIILYLCTLELLPVLLLCQIY